MTDKVISMADFKRTERALKEERVDAPDLVVGYEQLMYASGVLEDLANTGEVNIQHLADTFELVSELMHNVLDAVETAEEEEQDDN